MKIKMDNVEFVSFSDGICNIYTTDEDDNRIDKYKSLGYTNRVLGYGRVFAAKAVQIQTNGVIRVPQLNDINIHDLLEIPNMSKYEIVLVQNIFDTNPLSMDLTLRQLEANEVVENG
ncbi:hypothetical protein KM799_14180 [Clostridium tyrobutyricum]|uniref:hypothetical protein n=1 Tax=Clostridium tyrobutyricum TaxID=1519 RepID=UPI001C3957E5|nr:hypothetical protein [Clostridium tyrobutyricum]MBV4447748.1 hypothetical protein [Clostridium tyrobutyricum]